MRPANEIHEALRAYARDCPVTRAGVEILIRAFEGKYATEMYVRVSRSGEQTIAWVEPSVLVRRTRIAPSGEQLTIDLVEALLGHSEVNIAAVMEGVDDETRDIILAALAFIGGDEGPLIHDELLRSGMLWGSCFDDGQAG